MVTKQYFQCMHGTLGKLRTTIVLYLFWRTFPEWPWVALVCMQTVALMTIKIALRQKFLPNLIASPCFTINMHSLIIIIAYCKYPV